MLPGALVLPMLSLFAISLLSNATPFFGASYTLIGTTMLLDLGFTAENFILVVAVSALGASLAKIVIYSGALGFRKTLSKNKNVKLLGRWLGHRSFYEALFITALIPALPFDDYIFIGAGANGARLLPIIGVTFLAKLAKSAFEISLEVFGIRGITTVTGFSNLELSIILSVVFVILGVVLYKIDWAPLVEKAQQRFQPKPSP